MPHHTRFPFRPFPTLAALLSAFALASCGGGGGGAAPTEPLTIIEANIDTLAAQIGGGTQDVERYHDGSTDWALYTMANRFAATPVGMSKGAVHEIVVPGYIQHITLVKGWGERNYALMSTTPMPLPPMDSSA